MNNYLELLVFQNVCYKKKHFFQHLALQAHKNVSRGDTQAVLSLLTLLRHMTLMQRQYDVLLSSCQPSYKAQFTAIVNTLRETVRMTIFINDIFTPKLGINCFQTFAHLLVCPLLNDP